MSRKDVSPEHEVFFKRIGDKLNHLREEKGVTIFQMGKDLGMSRNMIAQLEKGECYVNTSTLLSIIDYFGQDPLTFFKQL